MPVLDSLPDPDTIKKQRGQIDYYVWKGLPVARKWPTYTASKRSPAVMTQVATYTTWLTTVHQTAPLLIQTARLLTAGSNWTYRDLLSFASSGNLYGQP